jgi:aspartyl aminopeptidase
MTKRHARTDFDAPLGAEGPEPALPPEALEVACDLMAYVDAAPSPYHAVDETARRLDEAGFERLEEVEAWEPAGRGGARCYFVRGGSLVAWAADGGAPAHRGFHIVAAHTDSPNLRVKAQPNVSSAGWRQLGVEVYGGVLLNTWLDRDLGLSGRVMVRAGAGAEARLLKVDWPLARVPQLAIHLDREVNDKGLVLDKQRHLPPVWALGPGEPGGLEAFVAGELEVARDDVLAWDLMLHDVQGSRLLGREQELIAAPRLDNLASCHAGLTALLAALEQGAEGASGAHTPVLCLFDHEEVGSSSRAGAGGPVLEALLDRAVALAGGGTEERYRARADSVCVSADMAHATHPNYPERHEPAHWIEVNGGPVIKLNTNQRYATDAEGEALFQRCCERAGVPVQKYFHRSNLGCGSTIGPITAARLGIQVVDVGSPQLSMHSARELCGSADPAMMTRALTAFYAS